MHSYLASRVGCCHITVLDNDSVLTNSTDAILQCGAKRALSGEVKTMMALITGRQKQAVRHGSMETTFALGKSGNLIAHTSVQNRSKFRAIIGGVIILFLDEHRHPIWTSHAHRYGVEGCWIGECDRTQNWTDEVPIDILPQIKGYSILQNQDLHWLDMMGQRRQGFAQWLSSDDGKETLEDIQRSATMLPETERLLLQRL